MIGLWLLLPLLVAPAAAAAQAGLPEIAEDRVFEAREGGAIVHRASGFVFPVSLADMPRRKVQIFAADNVMVQYTLRGGARGDAWLDLIVYPALRPLADEAHDIESHIVRNLAARPVSPAPPLPEAALGARSGWFEGMHQGIRMTSGYVIAQRGTWFVKVRATNPAQAGQIGMQRLLAAITAVPWGWSGVDPLKTVSSQSSAATRYAQSSVVR